MRTEQKLILAVGVLAGGFALSLPFRREAPSASPRNPLQSESSRDLSLTLRRDAGAFDSGRKPMAKPLILPHARITAVPDEERAAAQKKKAESTSPKLSDDRKTDALNAVLDTAKAESPTVETPDKITPPSVPTPAQPLGRIRDLKPL